MINRTVAISSLPSSSSCRHAATQTHGDITRHTGICCSFHNTQHMNSLTSTVTVNTVIMWPGELDIYPCSTRDYTLFTRGTHSLSHSPQTSFHWAAIYLLIWAQSNFLFVPPFDTGCWLLLGLETHSSWPRTLQCSALWVASRLEVCKVYTIE